MGACTRICCSSGYHQFISSTGSCICGTIVTAMSNVVYLIPSLLAEDAIETIPSYLLKTVNNCKVLFVENERTARRFLKKLSKELVIDSFEWFVLAKHENETAPMLQLFRQKIKDGKNIGIIS